MPRSAVSSRLVGVPAIGSCLISAANTLRSWMSARTALTSSTTRPADSVEAIGVWEMSCAPNAQQSAQTAPSAATVRSAQRRLSAATRVSRSIASVSTTASTTVPTTAPISISFVSVPPTKERNVSIPFPS